MRISFYDVLKQIKEDLIGKDSYRGVTFTYSWIANQVSHFSLGFIPQLACYAYLKRNTHIPNPALTSAIIISIMWLLFEIYNFLGPLIFKSVSKNNGYYVPGKKYRFAPRYGNIAFDTFTDLCFFWTGAFAACLLLLYTRTFENYTPQIVKIILSVLLVVLIFPSCYWYLTKMYLQRAQYPYQFRLSQWNFSINENDKSKVEQYVKELKQKNNGKHLLIFGTKNSGKTSLGIGIGTEISIRHNICIYTTAIKLFSMFYESNNLIDIKSWKWDNSQLLIIDDINPGDPIEDDVVSTNLFIEHLTNPICGVKNKKAIINMNVIWILGNEYKVNKRLNDWIQVLRDIGIEEKNISSINISTN